MKIKLIVVTVLLALSAPLQAMADGGPSADDEKIKLLIEQFSHARNIQDPDLLESILVGDIDQLTSSADWRRGRGVTIDAMMQSSKRQSGSRTLIPEYIRLLTSDTAVVDARYTIATIIGDRKMWSTFVVVRTGDGWKIAAIRNMLPARSFLAQVFR